jgi:hypothetical protein
VFVLQIQQVGQCIATGLWFSLGIQVSSTNKTDHHDRIKGDNTNILKFETRCATLWIETGEPKVLSNPFDALPVHRQYS